MNVRLVIHQLKTAQLQARKQLSATTEALKCLGIGHATRVLSKSARRRIGLAQKKRWALVRKGMKKAA